MSVILPMLLCALALLVAGATNAKGSEEKLDFGYSLSPPNLPFLVPYVALEKGFYKKNGLEVAIKAFPSASISMKALIAGDVEAGLQGTEALVARGRGSDVRSILIDTPVTDFVFLAQKNIKSVADLVGKRIAVSQPGAISWHVPRIFMKLKGVDPDKAEYVAMGSPASRYKAIVAKKVDASIVNIEHWVMAEKEGLNNIGLIPETIPELILGWTVVRAQDLKAKQGKFYNYVKAHLQASQFMKTNKEGTIEVALKWVSDATRENLSKTYDLLVKTRVWEPHTSLYEKSYDYTMKLLLGPGYLENPIAIDDFYDRTLVKRAMDELGMTPK